jgi:hypothetical protein
MFTQTLQLALDIFSSIPLVVRKSRTTFFATRRVRVILAFRTCGDLGALILGKNLNEAHLLFDWVVHIPKNFFPYEKMLLTGADRFFVAEIFVRGCFVKKSWICSSIHSNELEGFVYFKSGHTKTF